MLSINKYTSIFCLFNFQELPDLNSPQIRFQASFFLAQVLGLFPGCYWSCFLGGKRRCARFRNSGAQQAEGIVRTAPRRRLTILTLTLVTCQ